MLLAGCATQPAQAPEPAQPAMAPMAYGNLAQMMQAIPFPNSNIIFDAQTDDPGAAVKESTGDSASSRFAGVYGGWTAVENAAIALSESANLMMIPRMCRNGKPVPIEREDFQKYVQGLVDASAEALKAAQAKNLDDIVLAAGTLTEACANCHQVYRDFDNEADRCTPPAAE
jgi:hypothetical protein